MTENDEDRREPHDIGRIAYEAAAAATGCDQPWEQANQAKWTAAARAVLAWACAQMEQEAKYGCPCTEDERLTWENADLLRELGGLPKRDETPNVQGEPPRAASSREVGSTDGLGVAVQPAPTFEETK